MEFDLAIKDLVEVKAPGIRLGHRGHVVNRFARTRPLYAVQFPDNSVGFFERSELEKVPPEGAATDWERGVGFQDVADLESHYGL
ncbi:hypothetical protein ES703_115394 [subsurface metagenome]